MNTASKEPSDKAEALKKLMGKGWTGKLMKKTGLTRGAVHQMVHTLNTSHEHWHFAMELAREGKQIQIEIDELTSTSQAA